MDFSVNVCLQSSLTGGKNSKYCHNENIKNSCHSWRSETQASLVMDAFYDPNETGAFEFVTEWAEKNDQDAKNGEKYADNDQRVLWGSCSKSDDPDGGACLDKIWDKYFDSREKYDKLIAIKRRFDPTYVFTANGFGVDASNAPEGKQALILEKENSTTVCMKDICILEK